MCMKFPLNFHFLPNKSFQVMAQPKKVAQSAKQESSSDSSDESSSDEESAKKPAATSKKPAALASNASKNAESDSSSSDEDDEVSVCFHDHVRIVPSIVLHNLHGISSQFSFASK